MRQRSLALAAAVFAVAAVISPLPAMAQTPPPASSTPPALPAAQAQAAKVDLPVRGVTLFSSGVGYFEHFGTVAGDGSAELNFKTAQINDILKSLVLQDLDGGRIASVNYASQEPLDRKLRSFQVDLSGAPTLASLLAQLRGAKASIDLSGGTKLEGTILGVETRKVGQAQTTVDRAFLTVLAGGALRTVALDDVLSLRLEDPRLQDELTRALEALAGARDQEKKAVSLRFTGGGERRVRVGYVVETPVWKTSYRLLLGDKPAIQGWAIVENQTDRDWTNVQLSLVSGRPISFVQDLYTPLFIPRPVVVPELYASLRPQEYEGGVGAVADRGEGRPTSAGRKRAMPGAPAAAMPAPMMGAGGMLRSEENAYAEVPMDASASVQSVASAAKVGELFQYTVGSVTLPRQTSAMIPIVTDPLEVEKVSIYNMAVLPRNPLNGARVKNTTGKHLLAGPVTVLDAGTYAGDARIDNVPPGQERLLSFGIDLQTVVDAAKRSTAAAVQTASISRGVLTVSYKNSHRQEYVAENKSDADRTLIVEHPRQGGEWKLVGTAEPMEKTDALYRFKLTVPAGKSATLVVSEETTSAQSVALLNFEADDFLRYASVGEIPAKVRDALNRAADLKRAATELQARIADRQQQVQAYTVEQNRIRENLRTVDNKSEYAQRLLKKLNEQESAIEKLQIEGEQLREELVKRQKELSDYLVKLEL